MSVCTPGHAVEAATRLAAVIDTLKTGRRQTLVIGVGHGTCTCEGAAFEHAFNVEHELGDFGVGGMTFGRLDRRITSEAWMESLFRERNMKAITQAAVTAIEPGLIRDRQIDGTENTQPFDFAMLLPPFRGVGLEAFDRDGATITDTVFAPSGVIRVDANYDAKPFEQWTAADWPKTYQTPLRQRVRHRHRVRSPARDIAAVRHTGRGGHRPGSPTHRNAVRVDGEGRGHDHR